MLEFRNFYIILDMYKFVVHMYVYLLLHHHAWTARYIYIQAMVIENVSIFEIGTLVKGRVSCKEIF